MKKATKANVTKELHKMGFDKIELVQGDGYCYFVYDDVEKNIYETESVMACKVSHVDFDSWIETGVAFATRMD